MRWRPYTRCKPSGIEWLGDLPEAWPTPALATRYRIDLGKMLNEGRITGQHLLPYLRNVDVQWDAISFGDLPEMDVAPSERSRFTVAAGDLLVCEGGEVGRAAIVPETPRLFAYQKALHRLRPRKVGEVPRFMFYVLSAASHQGVFAAEGNPNTIPHLTGEKLRRYRFPAPPTDEQSAIADFLDRETARIDVLVAKKCALIEKLREKRSALISRTVTRGLPPEAARAAGLDPHPKVKSSGIDWLGEPPQHWELRRLKDHGELLAGAGFPHEQQGLQGEGLQFYKVGDLSAASDGRTMGAAPNTISPGTASALRASVVPIGSIIYAKIGAALFLNRRRVTSLPCCIDNNMTAFVPNLGVITTPWSFHWMSSLEFGEFANPGAVPSLGEGYQSELPLLVPPLAEQRAITDFLDRETTKIDALVTKVEAAIERLQEYRSALITAAVTGKIDVRGAVPAVVGSTPGGSAATPPA